MTTVAENACAECEELLQGWTRRRLRFDAHLNPKKSSLDMEPDEFVSFVPMDAVGEYGGLNLDEVRELEEVYSGYTYFADGDICIAKITPCFENGKGALAEGLANGIGFGTTELHIVRPGPSIDRRFLFYVSIADDFRKIGESEMYGAGGQKRIDEGFIKDWMPPLPPITTQQRIARFLDEKTARIDALIEKKRALLDRLAEKRQAQSFEGAKIQLV
ncbi:restriction endonuclease subunit S [Thiocystis violacea]|uniref:restriction endonuclease subunit S n=1 Tax=Thiocystis violacea TaxID=13725 RepID=UPI0019051FB5|nr:restriction endonuclease subunit S [Thiocystis violacea]